ncbi:MAG: type IV toxin-antitoxin system AbiEi family antitoxin domain-containing protein [Lachnospiraceae bacterium]|nr:type IV toxin-antitoxin system AbiEi family antitoxin domain-containing protein [Lachnospiraceae bacterium]
MTSFEEIEMLFEDNNGIVKTAQALESGISKHALYAYAKKFGVEQAAHGIFISKDAWNDSMYILHLRCAQGIFSHETALYLHDLTDREPDEYSITVKTGYNPANLKSDGVKVYTIKKELHDVGVTTMETPFGHEVNVYDAERTICDIVRSRSQIEMQTFQGALKQYAASRKKDLRRLMSYAQMFHVDKILRQYLEVLL